MKQDKFRVLFVCMGNICRSPAAEGVFRSMVENAGIEDRVVIDSAGTMGYHSGEPADARMKKSAQHRGYQLNSRARQITVNDLEEFDLVLTMDQDNWDHVMALAQTEEQRNRVRAFCDYCSEHENKAVPDPYYGGAGGFETVLDLLEDGCRSLLEDVQKRLT